MVKRLLNQFTRGGAGRRGHGRRGGHARRGGGSAGGQIGSMVERFMRSRRRR